MSGRDEPTQEDAADCETDAMLKETLGNVDKTKAPPPPDIEGQRRTDD